MKKIALVIMIALFSLSYNLDDLHGYDLHRIAIQNDSNKPLDLGDRDGHSVLVSPDRSGLLDVSVPQPPASPLIGITIKAGDGSWSSFIQITKSTRGVRISKDFNVSQY